MKSIHASGKRKRAVARATVKKGTGKIRINNKSIDIVAPKISRMKIMEPILLAGELGKSIDVNVKVMGGGSISQADASRLAIARAIVEYSKDSKLEKTYLDYDRGLLVADVRRKEANKPNRSKARAKRQKSYR